MSQTPDLMSDTLEHTSHMFMVRVKTFKDLRTGEDYKRTLVDIGHRAAVVILPLIENGVVFVRQYRHAVERICLELPSGVVDEGEEMWDAAARELEEETGYKAQALEYLCSVEVSPGWNNERQHFFVARGLTMSNTLAQDKFENIEAEIIARSEVPDMVKDGRLTDSKSISAIGAYNLQYPYPNPSTGDTFSRTYYPIADIYRVG